MNYTEEYLEQINTALEDEDFRRTLQKVANADEAIAAFAGRGIEVDTEMAQAMIEKVNYFKAGGELSEEELEMVAGGKVNWKKVWNGVKAVGATAVGCAVGGAITAAGGGTTAGPGIAVGSAVGCYLITRWCR